MPELDDAALERRLRGVLQEHLGALPLDLTVDALDRRLEAEELARRSARGRGFTLLAAAALLLVGGALAAGSGLLRLPTVVPPVPEPSVIAVATASPDATSPSPSESAAPSAAPTASPVTDPAGVWIATGTMGSPRGVSSCRADGCSSTVHAVGLLDGRVLVVGGSGEWSDPPTAELYDPDSGTWSATESMLKPQEQDGFPPTLLLDGRVLVRDVDGAELYDPASGTWSATGPMIKSADYVADRAVVLQDGRVLVTGQSGAQVYDPASGAWSATGNMITRRHFHTATLLRDGRVLAVGGYDGPDHPLGSAELYDPDTGSWTATADTHFRPKDCMGCSGGGGWATLLQDGTVLRFRDDGARETYDPATGTWTALAEPAEVGSPVALLSDGTVLMEVLDGLGACTAALYNPRTGSTTTASSALRCGGSFSLLLDGSVLVAGGIDCNDDVCISNGAAELYVPAGVSPPALPAFPSPPPPVFPSLTPRPTLFPPETGPVPPNAHSWKVTVDNRSSEPATLFVAGDAGMSRLVGSATPNVVPAGATVQVTFLFPDKGDNGWIYVNPRPGEGGGLVSGADIGIPGKIWIREDGEVGWLSP